MTTPVVLKNSSINLNSYELTNSLKIGYDSFRMNHGKKGQVALIVLLVLVVMLTVGLSVVSRTVTEVTISEHEEEAVRTFSAAEAGIEEILRRGDVDLSALALAGTPETISIGDFEAEVSVGEEVNNIQREIKENGSTKIDLSGATASGLRISWVDETKSEEYPASCLESSAPASLEVTIYREDGGSYSARRYAYNSCSGGDIDDNGFDYVSANGSGDFLRMVNIAGGITGDDKLATIRAVYNKTTVFVESTGGGNLGPQEYTITSRAVAEGEAAKAVTVTRTVSILPEIFDYVLFSGSDLVK